MYTGAQLAVVLNKCSRVCEQAPWKLKQLAARSKLVGKGGILATAATVSFARGEDVL